MPSLGPGFPYFRDNSGNTDSPKTRMNVSRSPPTSASLTGYFTLRHARWRCAEHRH
jgi:hypothetical protein